MDVYTREEQAARVRDRLERALPVEAFSIGTQTAELDDANIDAAGLREPLTKFCRELIRQVSKKRPDIVGVHIRGLEVQWLLNADRAMARNRRRKRT